MHRLTKKLLSVISLSVMYSSCALAVTPFFYPRSQSEDAARDLVGWTQLINLYDMCGVYGVVGITPEYTRSFKPCNIAQTLFGLDLLSSSDINCNLCDDDTRCGFIKVSGSLVPNRGCTDWLADYFGLPTDYQSILTFEPRVTNLMIDLSFYLGLDEWVDGLYLRFHAPVVHTRWDLNFCEKVIDRGSSAYLPGYFNENSSGVDRAQLVDSASDFLTGCSAPNLGCLVTFESLKNARLYKRTRNKTTLSDVQGALGWNFAQCDDYHFGLNLRGAAPTGNRPTGEYLFEPIVGNGHHWELGFGFTSHYTFWRSKNNQQSCGFYLDFNLTHLFSARQRRSFDLVDRPNSRYALASMLGVPVYNLFANADPGDASGSVAPSAQFQNVFTSVANLTTFDVESRIAAQFDLVALFNYTNCGWGWDMGYNFWTRSCEKIRYTCTCPAPLDGNRIWALKGDSFVYGFAASTIDPIVVNQPIALSATQDTADIHTGRNNFVGPNPLDGGIDGIQPTRNPGVDNAKFARFLEDNTAGADINDLVTGLQTKTSQEPVFLANTDIDLFSARTKGLSHKFFTHVSYTWGPRWCEWIPYFGAGAKVEFAKHTNPCTFECDSCKCQQSALSEWGIWFKGGVSFN